MDTLNPGVPPNLVVPVGGLSYLVPWGGPTQGLPEVQTQTEENNGLPQAREPQQNGPASTMFPPQL